MDALRRVVVDQTRYFELVEEGWARNLLAFAPGGHDPGQALGVRVFPIALGIPEDPATGSGNGCLAAWLARHRYLGASAVDVVTGQGYEMGRPSTLFLRASEAQGAIQVEVGGRVVEVCEGSWRTGGSRNGSEP
jgi:trans-2,3-dihydro-3-hydroxyanthranilate isomerase